MPSPFPPQPGDLGLTEAERLARLDAAFDAYAAHDDDPAQPGARRLGLAVIVAYGIAFVAGALKLAGIL